MFCSKCGRELPEGSRFCPGCGAEVAGASKPEQPEAEPVAAASTPSAGPVPELAGTGAAPNPASATAQPAPKRSRKPLVIGGVAVVAVAAIVVAVLFATGVLGRDGRLPNGFFTFQDNAFGFNYRIEQEGGDQVIELLTYDETSGSYPTMFTGTLEEDGSNELGKIWKVANLVDADGQPDSTVVRLQFPEGASSGELEGRWYVEVERDGETVFALREFDTDGSVHWVLGTGTGVIDDAMDYDEIMRTMDVQATLDDGYGNGGYGSCTWGEGNAGYYEIRDEDGEWIMNASVSTGH